VTDYWDFSNTVLLMKAEIRSPLIVWLLAFPVWLIYTISLSHTLVQIKVLYVLSQK